MKIKFAHIINKHDKTLWKSIFGTTNDKTCANAKLWKSICVVEITQNEWIWISLLDQKMQPKQANKSYQCMRPGLSSPLTHNASSLQRTNLVYMRCPSSFLKWTLPHCRPGQALAASFVHRACMPGLVEVPTCYPLQVRYHHTCVKIILVLKSIHEGRPSSIMACRHVTHHGR